MTTPDTAQYTQLLESLAKETFTLGGTDYRVHKLSAQKRFFDVAEVLREQMGVLNNAGMFRVPDLGGVNREQVANLMDNIGDDVEIPPELWSVIEIVLGIFLALGRPFILQMFDTVLVDTTFSNKRVNGSPTRFTVAMMDMALGDNILLIYVLLLRAICVQLTPNIGDFLATLGVKV